MDQYDNGVAGNPIDGYSFCGIDSNTTLLTVEETVGNMGYELKSKDTLGDSMTIMDFSKDTKTLRVLCIMEGPQ